MTDSTMNTPTEVQIKHRYTGAVLCTGTTVRNAVVDAIKRGADLCGADLCGAVLCGAVLRGADLCGAVLRGADLCGADLCGAVLRDAVLRDANLRGAVLRDANLRDAVLRDAVLRGAVLRGADLRGAVLSGADLRGAVIDRISITVIGTRHVIAASVDQVNIGCESHPLDYWLEHYQEIGRSNSYTPEQITEYGGHLERIKNALAALTPEVIHESL